MRTCFRRCGAVTLCALAALAGCGSDERAPQTPSDGLPQGREPVDRDPADVTTRIANPYWPMTPASRWVHRGRSWRWTSPAPAVAKSFCASPEAAAEGGARRRV
jgi:hypothetical protein